MTEPVDIGPHAPSCVCGDGWRFEATELSTGRVKAVLHPIKADWEEVFCQPSSGQLLLAAKDVSANDIWPHTTGVYISQVNPDGTRRARWAGYVEKFSGSAGGAVTVALNSIEEYLWHRYVADKNGPLLMFTVSLEDVGLPVNYVFLMRPNPGNESGTTVAFDPNGTQAGFAALLANIPNLPDNANGIPLTGVAVSPTVIQHKDFVRWTDVKNIGDKLKEMIERADGVKYRLDHSYELGTDGWQWSTKMLFSDSLGQDRPYTLRSDLEGWGYGLEIDAKNEADRVYGLGSIDGEALDPMNPDAGGVEGGDDRNSGVIMFAVAYDEAENLPEFQAAVNWNDEKSPDTLNQNTVGYVQDHRDPVAVPAMTLVGLGWSDGVPPPEELMLGDEVGVEIGYGVLTYRGQRAKILGIAWSLDDESPVQRTLAFQPVIRASTSVKLQVPAVASAPASGTPVQNQIGSQQPVADPWPTAGEAVKIQPKDLAEVSGMQYSKSMPDNVWVHNDENDASRQVRLINLATGNEIGSYTPSGPNRKDPEAIRLRPTDGMLVLADIGDNDNNRSSRRLFFTPEPTSAGAKGTIPSTLIRINYPFGARNAETLLIHPTSGEIFIVTKETKRARIVTFGTAPTDNMTGTLVKKLTDIQNVSDGTFTNNGQFVLFRAAGVQNTIVYRVSDWTKVGEIPTPAMAKSEAITIEGFRTGACSFLVTTEGKKPPIYRVLLPNEYGSTCSAPAGEETAEPPGSPSAPSPSTATVPGQILDLTQWKLTLPRN